MDNNALQDMISAEINQMDRTVKALKGIFYLIKDKLEEDDFAFVHQSLNHLRKINIELSETMIFWTDEVKKKKP